MKKRIGSLVLTLCMALALIPTAAIPVRAADYSPFGEVSGGKYTLTSQTYTLTDNVTLEGYIEIPSGVTAIIDLAGHTIDRGLSGATWPQEGGSVIVIANGGKLTLNDSSGNNAGKITGGAAGNGGGVCVGSDSSGAQANFTMNGGTITGNTVFATTSTTGRGGGVYSTSSGSGGVFTMTGGVITGNTTKYTVTNYVNYSAQAVGGGVYSGGVFLVSGNARIVENHAISKGNGTNDPEITRTENVYLLSDKKIYVNQTLGTDALIGVTIQGGATCVFTSEGSRDRTDLTKFFSDNSKYTIIKNNDSDLEMVDSPTVTTWSELYSKLQSGGTVMLGGDVTYGTGGGDHASAALTVPSGKTVILDLAGYTINRNLTSATDNGYVIFVSGSLSVKDSGTGGKITGGNHTGAGGGVYVTDSGSFLLESGSISGNKTAQNGGGVFMGSNAAFNMKGGTISGNTATSGGGIYMAGGTFTMSGGAITENRSTGTADHTGNGGGVNAYNGTFTMSGGEISNNTASRYGGGAEVKTFTMTGGTISGNTVTSGDGGGVFVDTGGTFNLSGNPTISGNKKGDAKNNVGLLGGTKITVTGTLSNTTPIGVSMITPGVFTNSTTTSYNDAAKFSSDASGYTVEKDASTNQLKLVTTHTVTITPGAHMTASSGSSSQTVAAGSAMTDVVYTADTGYFFPDDYSVSAVSGATVTRNSVSQITVSGTPTGDVSLSLTAPTQLNAISVSSSSHKTTYTVGDSLDVSGLVIALNDPAAATVNVTADMVSGFNSSTAGTKTLTITYGGKTTAYTVTVNNGATPSRPSYIAPEDEGKEDPEQPAQHFMDVADAAAWYYDAVYYGYDKGYFAGVSATEFAPGSTMTRAMFATVLYNMAGKPKVAASDSFPDVAAGKWYTNGVLWGVAQGVISGYPGGAFGTTDPVTREQMAVLFWNYAGKPAATADLSKFSDADKISAYAKAAMNWAVSVGVISGKGNGILDPKASATRAEVAQIVMNYDLAGK